MRYLILPAVLAMTAATAEAAVVASGSTQVGDTDGFELVGADTAVASNNAAYNSDLLDGGAAWVWGGDINATASVVFEFSFDLTGYDITTAEVSGFWGVDNYGTIALNGTQIASLPSGGVTANFQQVWGYGTDVDALFLQGANVLTYSLFDEGGQAAFRANVVVTADRPSQIPLPAGAPLLLGGLGLLALWRRKTA